VAPTCRRLRAREGGGEGLAGGEAGPTGPEGLLGRVLGGLASAAGGGRGVGARWLGHGRGLLLLLLGWLARWVGVGEGKRVGV
jgi:hypothetical protein